MYTKSQLRYFAQLVLVSYSELRLNLFEPDMPLRGERQMTVTQKELNTLKSMSNVMTLHERGHSPAYILETIQVACKRQNRTCTLSEMDVLSLTKFGDLNQTHPCLPNGDMEVINDAHNNIAANQPKLPANPSSVSDTGFDDDMLLEH